MGRKMGRKIRHKMPGLACSHVRPRQGHQALVLVVGGVLRMRKIAGTQNRPEGPGSRYQLKAMLKISRGDGEETEWVA